jgi:hypothetical protein
VKPKRSRSGSESWNPRCWPPHQRRQRPDDARWTPGGQGVLRQPWRITFLSRLSSVPERHVARSRRPPSATCSAGFGDRGPEILLRVTHDYGKTASSALINGGRARSSLAVADTAGWLPPVAAIIERRYGPFSSGPPTPFAGLWRSRCGRVAVGVVFADQF